MKALSKDYCLFCGGSKKRSPDAEGSIAFRRKFCYNNRMRNWGVDTTELQKDPEQFAIWRLEQLINFGTGGEKISAEALRASWDRLVLDKDKRQFLGFLLWGKKFLHRGN